MKRTHKKTAALLCCGLILLSAACGCRYDTGENAVSAVTSEADKTEAETDSATVKLPPSGRLIPCPYYDRNSFSNHTSEIDGYAVDGEIFCGTVPHHLLAGRLISGFLKTAAESRPQTDTVLVTATMHFTEENPICTSLCDWETPFGTLECDTALTEQLIAETGAVCDDDMAALDHGISALIPYIKHYFPDSRIAFLLVDEKADKDIPDRLAELYSAIDDKDCLFLFSADFSHYLPAHETERHDLETIDAVAERDYVKISAMTDDNVDSPYVLGTFLRLTEKCGAEPVLLDRSNSMQISGVPYSEKAYPEGLTSYLVFAGTE